MPIKTKPIKTKPIKREESIAKLEESIAKLNEPLLKAAAENDVEAVKLALANGADINAADKDDNTALHLIAKIAKKREPEDMKALEFLLGYKGGHESERNLEHKADVLLLNKEGRSALSIAEEEDESADVQAKTIRNTLRSSVQNKLKAAIKEADADLLKRAIEAGAEVDETHTILVVVELQKRERDSAVSAPPSKGSVWSRFLSFDSEKPSTVPAVKVPEQGNKLQRLQQLESDLWARRLFQALRQEKPDSGLIIRLILNKANPLHHNDAVEAVLEELKGNDTPIARALTAGILCRVLEVKNDEPWDSVEDMYKACTESLEAHLKTAKGFNVTRPVIGDLSMLRLVKELLPADSAAGVAAGTAADDNPLCLLRDALQTATNRALGLAVEKLNVGEVTAALRAGAQWRETAASAEGGGGGGAAAQPTNHLRTAIEKQNALAEEMEKLDLDIAKKRADIATADTKIQTEIEEAKGYVRAAREARQSAVNMAPGATWIRVLTELEEKADTEAAAADAAAKAREEAEKSRKSSITGSSSFTNSSSRTTSSNTSRKSKRRRKRRRRRRRQKPS